MVLALLFALGVANFAIHKAVLESGHPLLESLPGLMRRGGGRMSLFFEFMVLLAAMLMASNGWPGAAVLYFVYSLLNIVTGWLLLDGRI
ncbi:MAG: hypothetical protein R3E14_06870 [Erythrobacter sp.]